jgi:hypothetical protein
LLAQRVDSLKKRLPRSTVYETDQKPREFSQSRPDSAKRVYCARTPNRPADQGQLPEVVD